MLTLKYTKEGRARFLPHLDVLRHIQRTIRRAELSIEYSTGFNPHMRIFMSAPIPLGFSSRTEYFSVDTAESAAEFFERFNSFSIEGIKLVEAFTLKNDPVVASLIDAVEYTVSSKELTRHAEEISALLKSDYTYSYESKGKEVTRSIGGGIMFYNFIEDGLRLTVKTSPENLRPDRVLTSILRQLNLCYSLDYTREKVYTCKSGVMVELDDYLKKLSEL